MIETLIRIIQQFVQSIPPRLFVSLRRQGWAGRYETWDAATKASLGYGAKDILESEKNKSLALMQENAGEENAAYQWKELAMLMWIAAQHGGNFNIIDFGGSMGTLYYRNHLFLKKLASVQWNIVEQSHFVEAGQAEFEDDALKFYFSAEECLEKMAKPVHCLMFASVLQYLEKPYELLAGLLKHKIEYVFVTRMGFAKSVDRVTLQKVPKSYYGVNASYPCWIFEEQKFMDFFAQHGYELVVEYKEKYQINIPSTYKGLLFRKM
jgi:putative methyltransferase (TIGR04325 family)